MAKFKRFDPRNKKNDKHKLRAKYALNGKHIKDSEIKKGKVYYYYTSADIRPQGN